MNNPKAAYQETMYDSVPRANYGVTVWCDRGYVALEAGVLNSNIAIYRSYVKTI